MGMRCRCTEDNGHMTMKSYCTDLEHGFETPNRLHSRRAEGGSGRDRVPAYLLRVSLGLYTTLSSEGTGRQRKSHLTLSAKAKGRQ